MYGYTSWIFTNAILFLANLGGVYGFLNFEK